MSSWTKVIFVLFVLGALVGLLFYLFNRYMNNPTDFTANSPTEDFSTTNRVTSVNKVYEDLRLQALTTTPQQLGLDLSGSEMRVFGLVMDWNLGQGIATFVSYSSGDASMYTSSGGGTIGGIGHESVRSASQRVLNQAQMVVGSATKSNDTSFSKKNEVKFFFLTTKGRFVAEESIQNFDDGSSKWLSLFAEENELISALRAISE